jgi:hypothetical protein
MFCAWIGDTAVPRARVTRACASISSHQNHGRAVRPVTTSANLKREANYSSMCARIAELLTLLKTCPVKRKKTAAKKRPVPRGGRGCYSVVHAHNPSPNVDRLATPFSPTARSRKDTSSTTNAVATGAYGAV